MGTPLGKALGTVPAVSAKPTDCIRLDSRQQSSGVRSTDSGAWPPGPRLCEAGGSWGRLPEAAALQWESVCELLQGTELSPALSHHLGFPFSSSLWVILSINSNTLLL